MWLTQNKPKSNVVTNFVPLRATRPGQPLLPSPKRNINKTKLASHECLLYSKVGNCKRASSNLGFRKKTLLFMVWFRTGIAK